MPATSSSTWNDGAEGCDVGVHHLEGRPPADVLIGAVAPDDWVAPRRRGHRHGPPSRPGGRESEHARRTSVAVLVHRSGQVVSRLRVGDEVLARDTRPTA